MTSTVSRASNRHVFTPAEPKKRRHVVGIALFSLIAAVLPIERFLLTDATLASRIWWAMIAFLVLCAVGGRVARPPFPFVWVSALVLIPLGGLISGTTTNIESSLQVALPLALMVGLAPFVLRYYVLRSRAFLWVVGGAFVAAQSFSAAMGMWQLAGGQPFETTLIFGRTTGLAGHPNVLGIMAVIAMLGLLAALPRVRRGVKLVVVALLVLNGLALVFSGSLSAMLAATTGLVVVLAVKRRLVATFVTVVLGGALVATFAGAGGLDPFGALSPITTRVEVVLGTAEVNGGAASLSTRMLTYEWAWRYISADPLIGVGMDARNAGTYNGYTPVHNYILHAWYRGGLFFFIWQVFATVGYVRLLVNALTSKVAAVAAGLMMAIVVFAATSAFYDQQSYWMPLLLAIACQTGPKKAPTPAATSRSGVLGASAGRWG
ncbi:O-antigen ligase family protein [Microbacterium enclense]|uniref:O-antigen ligase family protein n=1 Tax=Microbacterium enclense TaxID=993073 RepID=UPI003D71F845